MTSYVPRKQRAVLESGLPEELSERFNRATDLSQNPYAPSRTAIIRRGIELALNEYEALIQKTPKAEE